jgi:hypothetical protein
MPSPSFDNRCVLALESRRAREIESLIATFGGRPLVAPAVKELPLESDDDTLALCDGIVSNQFDAVVFLTGVGVRALVDAVDRAGRRDEFVTALKRTRVVVRGPKPSAVLRELQVGDLIYIPGHVMMVIGYDQGMPYVIHDTTGIAYRNDNAITRVQLNGVSVTPLTPLLLDENQPLVDRIYSIQRIRL